MPKVTQRVGGGARFRTWAPAPSLLIPKPGPRAGSSTHPQLRSPFPLEAGVPRAGPWPGPPRLLGTLRLRPQSLCRSPTRAPGASRPAPVTKRSPEKPRGSGGSAPGHRPLPAHPPWAALAGPPPRLCVRASSPSGARAGGGASCAACRSG